MIRKVNLEVELRKLAQGKKVKDARAGFCEWALAYVQAEAQTPGHAKEVQWLEELYNLQSGNTR